MLTVTCCGPVPVGTKSIFTVTFPALTLTFTGDDVVTCGSNTGQPVSGKSVPIPLA